MNRKMIIHVFLILLILIIIGTVDLYDFSFKSSSNGDVSLLIREENSFLEIKEFNFNINVFLTFILVGATIFYTYITARILKEQHGPKLYAVGVISESQGQWDKGLMEPFDMFAPKGEGFTYSNGDKKWVIKIVNNGDRPATNIKIIYEITMYKNEIEFGVDRADIVEFHPIIHKQVSQTLKIDYIPPGGSVEKLIFFMSTYPEVQLSIINLISCENKYIKKRTTISKYKHEEFYVLEDSQHLRKMLGIY